MSVSFERIGYIALKPTEQKDIEIKLLDDIPEMKAHIKINSNDKQILLIKCPVHSSGSFMGVSRITEIAEDQFQIQMQCLGEDGGNFSLSQNILVIAVAKAGRPTYQLSVEYFKNIHPKAASFQTDKKYQECEAERIKLHIAANKHPMNKTESVHWLAVSLQTTVVEALRNNPDKTVLLSDQAKFYEEFLKPVQELAKTCKVRDADLLDPLVSEFLGLRAEQERFTLLQEEVMNLYKEKYVSPRELLLGKEYINQWEMANDTADKHPLENDPISSKIAQLLCEAQYSTMKHPDRVSIFSDPDKYHEVLKTMIKDKGNVIDLDDLQVSQFLSLCENSSRLEMLYTAIVRDKKIELLGPIIADRSKS